MPAAPIRAAATRTRSVFTLTTGPDTFVGGPADDTVNGTAATLNAGDSLTGGAGTDVLALYGSGTFRVDQLATFTGFASITLNNFTNGAADLYLGSQPIAVTGYGSGSEQLYLGSGAVTFQGGSGYNYDIQHFRIQLERRECDRWLVVTMVTCI